jgi:hypothetical protein
MSDIQAIVDENNRLKEELRRLYGVERPFICGNTGEIDTDNMPMHILVCPAYGSDGFALYKKIKPYSAPEY